MIATGQRPRAAPRRDDWGDEDHFKVDSFHATPIGIMLNVNNIAGDRSPVPQPVPPPMLVTNLTFGLFYPVQLQNRAG